MSEPEKPRNGPSGFDYRTLREVGQACYGAGLERGGKFVWVGKMAADLKVAPRTVERWASGDWHILPNIWRELVDICRERAVDMNKIAARLENGAPDG